MNELTLDTLKQRFAWPGAETAGHRWVVGLVGAWILVAVTSVSASALQAHCTVSGTDDTYLSCPLLGLELWEEGKRSESIFQQWNLTCDSTDRKRCRLDRTLIAIWPENMGGTRVSVHRHSTTDGTLRVLDLNLKKGKLEFEIVYPEGERMPVLMRLKRLAPDLGMFYVESFQAKDVVRTLFVDKPVSQEWRIPDYTYSVKLEIVIPGKKSADQKMRHELVKRLAPSDRAILDSSSFLPCQDFTWSAQYLSKLFKGSAVAQLWSPYEAQLREIETKLGEVKDSDKTSDLLAQLYALETQIVREILTRNDAKNVIRREFNKCLAEAGMSLDGRRAVSEFLLAKLYRDLEQ